MVKDRTSLIVALLLICSGALILVKEYYFLDGFFVRSYGFFLFGLLAMLATNPKPIAYVCAWVMLTGGYYLLSEWNVLFVDPGLTVSVLVINAGLAFFLTFALGRRKWQNLVYGTVIAALGCLFLMYNYTMVSYDLLYTVLFDYWPVGLIIVGVVILINSQLHQHRPLTSSSGAES